MKLMLHILHTSSNRLLAILMVLLTCSSCDLALQKDHDYHPETLEPHVDMTAWEYLNTRTDIFSSLIEALEFTGLDEYYKQNDHLYTFLALTNTAMKTYMNNAAPGVTELEELNEPQQADLVKTLKYHIVDGEYSSYGQLPVEPIFVITLLSGKESGLMTMLVRKNPWQADAGKIIINDAGSNGNSPMRSAVSSNIMPTNGVVHVFNNYCYYLP